MKDSEKYNLFLELIRSFDMGYSLVNEYNALLHDYNGVVLYQAESQFINKIGINPGITVTELASYFEKTISACSQLMRRMKNKGWLYQERNEENNREFKLYLTEEGKEIYRKHASFENACYQRTAKLLDNFSKEDLHTYIRIQDQLNAGFKLDVEESRYISGYSLQKP